MPDGWAVLAAVALAGAVLLGGAGGRRHRRLLRRQPPSATPAVEVADVADLLALALASGCGVGAAMTAVAEAVPGRLGDDLAMVVAAHGWGLSDGRAWGLLDPGWQPVARALVLAEAAGVPPSTTLASAAQDIRRREAHRLTVASERLGVRLVLPLGATFLPAFVATTVIPVVAALADQVLSTP